MSFELFHKLIKFYFFCLFLTCSTYALVDYTPKGGASGTVDLAKKAMKTSVPVLKSTRQSSGPSSSSQYVPTGLIDMGIGFEKAELLGVSGERDLSYYLFEGHVQTPYNIFIDYEGGLASTKYKGVTKNSGHKQTSQTLGLGLNWIRFGSAADMIALDLILGLKFGSKSSPYARDGVDKYIGLQTMKKFFQFGLGIGYKMHMLSSPKDRKSQLDTGNIHQLFAEFGFQATDDIYFKIEGDFYRIGNGPEDEVNSLKEAEAVGVVSPKLDLKLAPFVSLTLGGRFQSNKASDPKRLIGARFFDFKGIYGNSFFTKLAIGL